MRAHSALLSAVFGSTGRACAGAAGRSRVSGGAGGGGLRTGGFGSAVATGPGGMVVGDRESARGAFP